uniref:DIS3-like exonuclease 2 n=1 Tax=Parascaris univalens TaxID=6257 RepID=A0A915A718_PARUN
MRFQYFSRSNDVQRRPHEELRTNIGASLYICVSVVVGWLVRTSRVSAPMADQTPSLYHRGRPANKVYASLSAEELALLSEIQRHGRASSVGSVRTGKITVSELMGRGDENAERRQTSAKAHGGCNALSELQIGQTNVEGTSMGERSRPHGISVDPATLLDVAGWKVPALPPGLMSITHEADRRPYASVLPPSIFEKAMKAAAIAHAGSHLPPLSVGGNGSSSGYRNAIPLPTLELVRMLPPMSPVLPIVSNGGSASTNRSNLSRNPFNQPFGQQRGNGVNRGSNVAGGGHQRQYAGGGHSGGTSHNQSAGGSQHRMVQQSQKTRKPYFMPYMSLDAVNRGLASGDLVKGALRVNQRNYEESYVDNPLGDDQQDILIVGVHDRNRALHGDVVVVRVKERINWVVRDALYEAWRGGHLKAEVDDDGQPITIPPLKRSNDECEPSPADLLDLPVSVEKCVSSEQLKVEVPVPSNRRYTREQVLCIAAKMELMRRKKGDTQDGTDWLNDEVQVAISKLAIAKRTDSSPTGVSQSQISACGASMSSSATGTQLTRRNATVANGSAQRRLNYRILSDMSDDDWGIPDVCLQKTAEVVFILEQKNSRKAVGMLKVMADGNRNWALFSPGDSRMPRMMIPADQMPAGFFERPQDFSKYIFAAHMVEWQATAQFARGKLYKSLGLAGDIEAETEGLLLANDVDTREFSAAALSSLPVTEEVEWTIDEKEFKYRRDFREETVVTIDPSTARDLDDALHIKPIDDCDGAGTPGWEVGVHIADVSHFVQAGTELDHWATSRATSVYLVHKVVPMLPRILCEDICSLNPGKDRLTFSVVWKMNDKAEVFEEWFGRSIIRSCCKLAYEHAQDFIDNPEKEFGKAELPEILNNKKSSEIKELVLRLNKLAEILRARRSSEGCLQLDQPKLCFVLNETSGLPDAVAIYERKEAHKLVEEFMLLANMAVARKIEHEFPRTSLLRRHPPPKIKVLRDILERCENIGFAVDGSSSATIASSLRRYEGNDELKRTIVQVLSYLLMKSMQLALYFCTGTMKSTSEYAHYALSVPYYTHFTSPIRRYADVMVHRLLSAALGYSPPPALTIKELDVLANHCNDKKITAKAISESSDDMFFGVFVKEHGPFTERAVVLMILDASFDVLIIRYGVVKRVYVNRLKMARDPRFLEGTNPTLTLYWDLHNESGSNAVIEQTISMCTIIDVVLSALPEPTKYQATIKPPSSGEKMRSLAEAYAIANRS